MLRPSYTELMELLNSDPEMDSKISSRYTIVIAVAKRARQLIAGAEKMVFDTATDKAVSVAVNEMNKGLVKVKTMSEKEDDKTIFLNDESIAE